LLGGHGKIGRLLTPLLLSRSWTVTSLIRTPSQIPTIQSLAPPSSPGTLHTLVHSLEDIKSPSDAQSIIDKVRPDYIVFSAGAAGQGGPARTYAIDRDAAICFIRAAAATPRATKFLLVSYIASRRNKPAWWDGDVWEGAKEGNRALETYYQAKVEADEALYKAGMEREGWTAICLRPGTLTAEKAGNVELGKTRGSQGAVSRASVARVMDELLAREGVGNVWLDLLDGEEEIGRAVERVVGEGVDAAEGE
ncbi:hypothetical protein B0T18DRAFT_288818, partial [Schizothecium vesticola]